MKRLCISLSVFTIILLSNSNISAQNIGINADGSKPNPNAMLDIKSNTKGLLIPRTNTTSRIAIPNTKGLLVYDTTTNSFWYNDGALWNNLSSNASGWSLSGNSNTDTSINFIGTTDGQPLLIKVNNNLSGFIDYNFPFNSGWGYQSLFSNITGQANTANGYQALLSNTGGFNNTASGLLSLQSNITGNYNTAYGANSLSANTLGTSNTAIGEKAMFRNTTSNSNTVVGSGALYNNRIFDNNTAVGFQSLYNNNAPLNVAVGYQSMFNNTTGTDNTATGSGAMQSNTTGFNNTAMGNSAMSANTTGSYNTAVGSTALLNNTGSSNTAVGEKTMQSNLSGSNNTALGSGALQNDRDGNNSTAIGFQSLYYAYDDTGVPPGNTAVGYHSLYNNTRGEENTAVGLNALYNNNTGDGNTAVGHFAGVNGGNINNASAFGYGAVATSSNSIVLGNLVINSIGGYANWTNISDGRYKQNIKQNVPGLEFIKKLNALTYTLNVNAIEAKLHPNQTNLKTSDGKPMPNLMSDPVMKQAMQEKSQIVYTGFVAQDVEKAAQSLNYDFSGVDKPKDENKSFYGLRYADFVVPLVKAVQELSAQNDGLKAKVDILEKQQHALMNNVNSLLKNKNN